MAVVRVEEEDAILADGEQHSVFDPAGGIVVEAEGDDAVDLPYEGPFKDAEDCGWEVNDGVAKRVNSACTKGPAKGQLSPVQKKYPRPNNCEFLSPTSEPRVMGQFAGQNDKS